MLKDFQQTREKEDKISEVAVPISTGFISAISRKSVQIEWNKTCLEIFLVLIVQDVKVSVCVKST